MHQGKNEGSNISVCFSTRKKEIIQNDDNFRCSQPLFFILFSKLNMKWFSCEHRSSEVKCFEFHCCCGIANATPALPSECGCNHGNFCCKLLGRCLVRLVKHVLFRITLSRKVSLHLFVCSLRTVNKL